MKTEADIREIREDKGSFLPLLLLADPSPEMVKRYLEKSFLFVGFENHAAVCCAAVLPLDEHTAEIKNLAVAPAFRQRGWAGKILRFIETRLRDFDTLILGTGTPGEGEPPFWQEEFYTRYGFRPYRQIKGFFTDHYPEPIYEDDGRICRDMIYLRKSLR